MYIQINFLLIIIEYNFILIIIFAGAAGLLVVVAVDIALLPRSRFHTWSSLFLTYIVRRACHIIGWFSSKKVKAKYSDLYNVQERFVLDVVRRNADSDYGRDHHFSEILYLQVSMADVHLHAG